MSKLPPMATIVARAASVIEQIIESDGSISIELQARLEEELALVTDNLAEKVDDYAYIIGQMKAQSVYFKDRAKALDKVAKACTDVEVRLRENIKHAMSALNTEQVVGEERRFSLIRQGTKLVIDDESAIPANYFREKVIYELDKDTLKKDLEAFKYVPGAHIEFITALREYAVGPKQLKVKND